MTSNENKSVDINKYRKKKQLNIGVFLFAAIFLYLIITIIRSLMDTPVSIYEVREGSIVKDTSFTGLVIRQEEAVTATENGYISFYQPEGSKVKNGSKIYILSEKKLQAKVESEQSEMDDVGKDVLDSVSLRLQGFNKNYRDTDFSSVYNLKNDIMTSIQGTIHKTKTAQLDAAITEGNQQISSFTTQKDGIVLLRTDGMEGITKQSFLEADFDRSSYHVSERKDGDLISASEPVYRIVTSEDWSVIVPLDKEIKNDLLDMERKTNKKRVQVRIDKDSEMMTADYSILTRDGTSYCCLDFDNSMIRYAQERYLNVELILEDQSGLKIPRSSVVEEEFYTIPSSYFLEGGNSSSEGLLIQTEKDTVFTPVDYVYRSEDQKMEDGSFIEGKAYISKKNLRAGDVLVKPESSETFMVGETGVLNGVYNINKGYAVFRWVNILCENEEYYIVEEGVDYSLSNYDHIVQNGNSITQDEIIY